MRNYPQEITCSLFLFGILVFETLLGLVSSNSCDPWLMPPAVCDLASILPFPLSFLALFPPSPIGASDKSRLWPVG